MAEGFTAKSKIKSGGIAAFLRAYTESDPARFHMPGHKGQLPSLEKDITEIPGADKLVSPNGLIALAQDQAAKAFGASKSFFLTGGSTSGLLAMLLSLPQGSRIALSRDCHISAISGIVLAGLDASFIYPRWNADENLICPIDVSDLAAAKRENENISALLITRPDYFGRCPDIAKIAEFCQENDILLLVDEAHGSHFRFSDLLPESAANYADMWTNSAHKTLAAPNQAAYLHLAERNPAAPNAARVSRMISLVQTTSPSYPILASLDEAWRTAAGGAWTDHIDRLERFHSSLPQNWQCAALCAKISAVSQDPTRLVFDTVDACGQSGYEVDSFLQAQGIFAEMSDQRRIVLITTPLDPDAWYQRLSQALESIPEVRSAFISQRLDEIRLPSAMGLREAFLSETECLPIEKAIGRIAAQPFGIYPPGVALALPGERITKELVDALLAQQAIGAQAFGLPLSCVLEER